jgi:serine/threonine-protein kinase
MPLLTSGFRIRDTYEVERYLGEGAFAEVYRVNHRFLGRQAIKVFKRRDMTLPEIEEMLGEAIMLSKIGHPNIVRVFDANVLNVGSATYGYFTMENVPAGSLEKFWHSHGTRFIPVATTVEIIKQICRGLSVAHKQSPPVIHRDIKPQNILVGYEADGLRARLGDFGLAKRVNPLTLLATAAGTPAFKPPEAFKHSKGDSCAADIWALGTTLYLLLTDQLPYEMPTEFGWGNNPINEKSITPTSDINPDATKDLDRILVKSLSYNPSDRYSNAMEFLAALEKCSLEPEIRDQHPLETSGSLNSKTALGNGSIPYSKTTADEMVKQALATKKQGKLGEAADILEEAFNKWPDLRIRYENQVKLWRCGVSM